MVFFSKESIILGNVVNVEGISPNAIKDVQSWPMSCMLTNAKEVRSILGTCSYYRKFIKDFSKIARPFNRLIKKKMIFKWNSIF